MAGTGTERDPFTGATISRNTLRGSDAVDAIRRDYPGINLNPIRISLISEEGYVPKKNGKYQWYADTKGKLTTGLGQLKGVDVSKAGLMSKFKEHDIRASKLFGPMSEWDTKYSAKMQATLYSTVWRGTAKLDDNDVSMYKWVGLFNEGKYLEASQEYLDNREYENPTTASGIKARMEREANSMVMEATPWLDEDRDIPIEVIQTRNIGPNTKEALRSKDYLKASENILRGYGRRGPSQELKYYHQILQKKATDSLTAGEPTSSINPINLQGIQEYTGTSVALVDSFEAAYGNIGDNINEALFTHLNTHGENPDMIEAVNAGDIEGAIYQAKTNRDYINYEQTGISNEVTDNIDEVIKGFKKMIGGIFNV